MSVTETGLAMIRAGLRPVAIHAGRKKPIGLRWGAEPHTEDTFTRVLRTNPTAGIGCVLGDIGDGTGIVDFEVDNATLATDPIKRIFGGKGPTPTLSFLSNKGPHYLYAYTPRLAWFGVELIDGKSNASYAGLELRVGTNDPASPNQKQSVFPPTLKDDGTPRVFLDPAGDPIDPVTAVTMWRELVAPFPASLMRDIELFGIGYEESETGVGERWIDAEEVKAAIAGRACDLAESWGVKFTSQHLSTAGFRECFAVGRDESNPSAGVNNDTGVYMDHGSGKRLSFFSLAVAAGAYPNVKEAINGIGISLGVKPSRRLAKIALETTSLGIDAWEPEAKDVSTAVPPFPIHVFPPAIQTVAEVFAEASECPIDFVGGAFLGVVGGAIGNSVAIQVAEGYTQPAHQSIAIVAPPGTRKSPALRHAAQPIRDAEHSARMVYEEAKKEHEDDPEAVPSPVLVEYLLDDATREAVAAVHSRNPRGLILIKDELTGWVSGQNAYRSGRGDDQQFWLSVYSGAPTKVNRKGLDASFVIPRPSVAVLGALTPESLPSLINDKRDDGWLDRLLFVYPDVEHRPEMSWATITDADREAWAAPIRRLLAVPMREGDNRKLRPHLARLTPDAVEVFGEYVKELRAESRTGPEWLRGPNSKFEGVLSRISLALSQLDAAAESNPLPALEIGPEVIERAGVLLDYFRACLRRAFGDLGAGKSEGGREGRQIVAWVASTYKLASNTDTPATQLSQAARTFRQMGNQLVIKKTALKVGNKTLSPDEFGRGLEWAIRNGYFQAVARPANQDQGPARRGRPTEEYAFNPYRLPAITS